MDDCTKNILDICINLSQLLIVAATSAWAYYRFRKEGTLDPRIEFDIDCKFFGPHHNYYLASTLITASNKGNIEHKFKEIIIRVRGIHHEDTFQIFKKCPPTIEFKEVIVNDINIIPSKEGYYFVRPGIKQDFSCSYRIDSNIKFISVHARFIYEKTQEPHTTERIFELI